MPKKVTIKDIARELNTAYSTISRALNNKTGISDKKRQEILQKAQDMGYEPNILARQLKSGGSNTVGLIVPRINRVFFSNVIHGVESEAKANGFNIIICQSNENLEDEEDCIKTLLANNIAGILMSHSIATFKAGAHKEIVKRKLPFVMFDRVLSDIDVNRVLNDNFYGAREVTRHMIEQGYRDIVHFAGPTSVNIYRERANGYKQAMKEAGLAIGKQGLMERVITKDSGYQAINKLISSNRSFDAIFAASDFSALGAIRALQDLGSLGSGHIGVAGYANEPFTELIDLTTVDQKSIELGRSAALLLFEEIKSGQKSEYKKEVVIKPELIIRQSTNKSR